LSVQTVRDEVKLKRIGVGTGISPLSPSPLTVGSIKGAWPGWPPPKTLLNFALNQSAE